MNQFGESIRSQQRVLFDAIDSRVNDCVDMVTRATQDAVILSWPGLDRPVHVYATGRSKLAWQVGPRETSDTVVYRVIRNDATDSRGREYAQYTDVGATYRGARTARPWRLRQGNMSYLMDTWGRLYPGLERVVQSQMNRV